MEINNRLYKTICIILVNFNNNQDTVDCVSSIMESIDAELPFIIIVDNSEQKSNLEERLSFYPDLKVLFQGTNLGFARGNNLGIKWAFENLNFDYLFILNNDTIVEKKTLSKLVSYAGENTSVHFFTPCIITSDTPPKIWYAGGTINYSKMTPDIFHIGKEYNEIKLNDISTEFASGCALFLSASSIDRNYDFFDPFFFMYDEDVEISLRLKNMGIPIHFVCQSIIIHKCQGSQVFNAQKNINQLSPRNGNLIFYLKNTIKNRYYITGKHFSGIARMKLKLKLSFYWLAKCFQYLLYFRLKASFIVPFEILKYMFSSQLRK